MSTLLENLQYLLTYHKEEPLLFTSGLFLFLFLGFTFFYGMMRRKVNLRIMYVILFSLYFYYKTSGFYFLLIIFTATSDFIIGHYIAKVAEKRTKKLLVALSVVLNLGLLGVFKYTDFLIEIINNFVADPLSFKNFFLPIGISFFTFQSLSYIIDIYRGKLQPLTRWMDYLFYISFFPQLVAGPIVRAKDFIPQIRQNPLIVTRAQFGEGFWLILCGLFKKAVISDFISLNFVDRIFDNPMLYTGLENLMGVWGYALQIYCDFSGYSDMAIGIALLLGFRFNANFDSPYKSATITEFWRRWHISLSSWLKDYLYISLGGNRKGKIRTYINLMITMLLGGLWHGPAMRYIIWGGIHGASLAIHKGAMSLFPSFKPSGDQMSRGRRILGIFVTFHLVCASWIFFRAPDMETVRAVFYQIFTALHPEIFFDFIIGYKWVVLLMATGYVLHFTSRKFELRTLEFVQRLPIFWYAVSLTLMIWVIMQMKSGDVQPFIYFQF